MSHRSYFPLSFLVGLILTALFSELHAQVTPSKGPFLYKENSIQVIPSLELVTENDPSEGYIFLSAFNLGASASESHLIIADNKGNIVQSKSLPFVAIDFHVQGNGTLSYFDSKKATYTILDSGLNEIRDLPIDKYPFDNHELIVLPDGGYLFIGEDNYQDDLSKYSDTGATDALVLGKVILEYNAQGKKVFEWRTRDHIPLTEATIQNLRNTTVNPYHFNCIEIDQDSNLIISARNLDQVFKIHRQTGEFMWRFGGKKNEFTLAGDSVFFSWQHSPRILPNGNLILFDNGTNNAISFSRACEYKLDPINKTATLVRQFRHTPDLFGRVMGSVEHLPNDNILIGWGSETRSCLTEIDKDNTTKLEMRFSGSFVSYRAFKHLWNPQQSAVSDKKSSYVLTQPTLYPNPATDHVSVRFELKKTSDVHISLIDELGRVVLTKDYLQCSSGYSTASIDVANINAGIYTVKLQTEETVSYSRLVIQ
jgi:hypothetical protein